MDSIHPCVERSSDMFGGGPFILGVSLGYVPSDVKEIELRSTSGFVARSLAFPGVLLRIIMLSSTL